jgi:hypothetical protein
MHLGILALFPISFAASGLAAGQKWVVPYPMIFSSLPFSHKTYPENALVKYAGLTLEGEK